MHKQQHEAGHGCSTGTSSVAWTLVQASLPVKSCATYLKCNLAGSFCLLGISYRLHQDHPATAPSQSEGCPLPGHDKALKVWSEGLEDPSLPVADAPKQRSWDPPRLSASFKVLLDSPPDTLAQACQLAASEKESDIWLQTLLASALGLRMDNDVIRVVMGLRLFRNATVQTTQMPPVWDACRPPGDQWLTLQEQLQIPSPTLCHQ